LTKWLTNKLKDFPDPPGLFVKYTQEFVEKVKDIQLAQDVVLTSFDVEVPIPEVLKQFDTWLKTLKHSLPTCFHGTHGEQAEAPTALPRVWVRYVNDVFAVVHKD
jgi:hypothetical protein